MSPNAKYPMAKGKKKRLLLWCVLWLGSMPVLCSQPTHPTPSKRAVKCFERSKKLLRKKKWERARKGFYRVLAMEENFVEAHGQLSSLYAQLGAHEKSRYHLETLLKKAPDHPLSLPIYFKVGTAYYREGNYEKARFFLDAYLSRIPDDHELDSAKRYRRNIDFAMSAMEAPVPFVPEKLPDILNQFPMQYFPSLNETQDKMIFTVRKGHTLEDDEDLYISEKPGKDEAWTKPKSLSSAVNTAAYNEGSGALAADGTLIIFTSCQRPGGKGSCDLYTSHYRGGHWQSPENLGAPINTVHWESQPVLSADKRTLYFVSNRPGGIGKKDLWQATRCPDGTWGGPLNMGKPLNTPADDISPFIHQNGASLYFSSNGHVGMGGHDLYLAEKEPIGAWGTPKNLGFPINNHKDEVSLFVDSKGLYGYYTDEKTLGDGTYESYLYRFLIPQESRTGRHTRRIRGFVKDKEKKSPLGARLSLFFVGKSGEGDALYHQYHSHPVTGRFEIAVPKSGDYRLDVHKEAYIPETLRLPRADTLSIYLVPAKEAFHLPLTYILFPLNGYTIDEPSALGLQGVVRFLKEHEHLTLRITGHTDDEGRAAYNQALSTRRARSVHDFLLGRGIEKERLFYEGYGSTRSRMPNSTPENREKNRCAQLALDRMPGG